MEVFGGMKLVYDDICGKPEIQTAYREWTRFMSVAYGSFYALGEVFLVHTYLSVFANVNSRFRVPETVDYFRV